MSQIDCQLGDSHGSIAMERRRREVLTVGGGGGPYTDMRRLTTEIRSEKCVVRRFRRCANAYLHKPR